MSNTVRTPIVDKNGKQTTVHKKADESAKNNRISGIGLPPKTKKKTAPGLLQGRPSDAAAWNPDSYVDESYGEFSNIVEPSSRAETLKALNDITGRKSKGEVRWIELNYHNTDTSRLRSSFGLSKYDLPLRERKDTFNIVPPSDGTPMIVRNRSGFTNLNIESGNAIIALNSNSGNPLEISGDANVVVILGEGAKCNINVSGDATVLIVPQNKSRGYVSPKENAKVEIVDYVAGADQHAFSDMSIKVDYEALAKEKAERSNKAENDVQTWMSQHKNRSN